MNQDLEKAIREYKITLIVGTSVIVFCMVLIEILVFIAMPTVVYKVSKQALNEVYDERIQAAN